MTPRRRVLKDIRVSEISLVDRGAGDGVKIVLAKRWNESHPNGGTVIRRRQAVQEDKPMPAAAVDIEKASTGMFEACVSMIQKREACSRSEAYTRALRDPVAREAYDLQRDAYLTRMQKLGEGSLPQPAQDYGDTAGGRVGSPTRHAGHGDSSNYSDPHRGTEHDVGEHDGDRETERLRDLHPKKAHEAFEGAVRAYMAANPDRSESECRDMAMRDLPHLWARAKMMKGDGSDGRSPLMPPSHDGNALRPSGTDFDEANRRTARSGERPY
jgi:hypothetical protein